jgi:hypothetical protein
VSIGTRGALAAVTEQAVWVAIPHLVGEPIRTFEHPLRERRSGSDRRLRRPALMPTLIVAAAVGGMLARGCEEPPGKPSRTRASATSLTCVPWSEPCSGGQGRRRSVDLRFFRPKVIRSSRPMTWENADRYADSVGPVAIWVQPIKYRNSRASDQLGLRGRSSDMTQVEGRPR